MGGVISGLNITFRFSYMSFVLIGNLILKSCDQLKKSRFVFKVKGRRPFKDCFRYSAAFLVIVAGACPDFEIYFQKKKKVSELTYQMALRTFRGSQLKKTPCNTRRFTVDWVIIGRSDKGWHWIDIRLAQDWNRTGTDWRLFDTRLVLNWPQIVMDWHWIGFGLTSGWIWHLLTQECH